LLADIGVKAHCTIILTFVALFIAVVVIANIRDTPQCFRIHYSVGTGASCALRVCIAIVAVIGTFFAGRVSSSNIGNAATSTYWLTCAFYAQIVPLDASTANCCIFTSTASNRTRKTCGSSIIIKACQGKASPSTLKKLSIILILAFQTISIVITSEAIVGTRLANFVLPVCIKAIRTLVVTKGCTSNKPKQVIVQTCSTNGIRKTRSTAFGTFYTYL